MHRAPGTWQLYRNALHVTKPASKLIHRMHGGYSCSETRSRDGALLAPSCQLEVAHVEGRGNLQYHPMGLHRLRFCLRRRR